MYLESITDASERVSGKLPPWKFVPPVRVRVWFRISVRIRAGGSFPRTFRKMPIKKNE